MTPEPWPVLADKVIRGIIAFVVILLLLIAAISAGYILVRAEEVHEWIHRVYPSCCNGSDCHPVQAWPTAGGWMVMWHGVETPFVGSPLPSPGVTVACGTRGWIRCLFISGGVS